MASADNVPTQAGLDLDEMGQIESDRHFGTPLEEQGTRGGQSDFVYSHHHSSFMSQSSSYESFKERVIKVVQCMTDQKKVKSDELEKAEWEKQQLQDKLMLKEEQQKLFQEKYDLHMTKAKDELEKKDVESKKKLAEKDQLLKEKDDEIGKLKQENQQLREEVEMLKDKNHELQQRITNLQKDIQILNQNVTTVQNENQAIKDKVEQSISKDELGETIKKVEKAMEEKLATMLQSMSVNVQMITSGDGNKVCEYKPHSVSPSHSPSRSPVHFQNGENNNLNV